MALTVVLTWSVSLKRKQRKTNNGGLVCLTGEIKVGRLPGPQANRGSSTSAGRAPDERRTLVLCR